MTTLPPDVFPRSVAEIIDLYDRVVRGVRREAEMHERDGTRALGGVIRMTKGKLVERIGKSITHIAWNRLGGGQDRLSINDVSKYRVEIEPSYLDRLPSDISDYIRQRLDNYFYEAQVDIHTFVDGRFVLGIECKSYTENAMLKRVLYDFSLLKSIHPDLKCCLLQMESQLGGDYSNPSASPQYGSRSTHTLMSYSKSVDLDILTLLDGERNVERPIDRPEHFKELTERSVEAAILRIQGHLRPML